MVLAPVLFFGLLELGLRLLGSGDPTSFFLRRTTAAETENPEFARRFFPAGLARAPLGLSLPEAKPAETCRIFILGESAALGIPNPSAGFGRVLEVMLRDRYPDRRFEVVNTSIVAINSHVILPIARECAGRRPDLFIVLMGNNEVVGPYGASGVLGPAFSDLRLIRAHIFAKSTRTGQLVDRWVQSLRRGRDAPRFWNGMEMFVKSRVRAGSDPLRATHDHFRVNLDDVCRAGTGSGAKVVLCTVPVNLKDSAPFGSVHSSRLSIPETRLWHYLFRDGAGLEDAGQFAQALARYRDAAELDDQYADLHFRLGRCHAALGRGEDARRHFLLARDLDALRFRADSTINKTIRDVARARAADGVSLVDAERDFEAASPSGLPGEDLFYEHVHMNFEGNVLLARSVFRKVIELLPPANAEHAPLSANECADRLAYTEAERLRDLSKIHEMFHLPPFTNQLDHSARDDRWRERLRALRDKLGPEAVQKDVAACRRALQHLPDDAMLRMRLASALAEAGEPREAARQYEAVLKQRPFAYQTLERLGTALLKMGQLDEAAARYRAALRIKPDLSAAHYGLAEVHAARGAVTAAIAILTDRVENEPDRVEALRRKAAFLDRVGKPRSAKTCLEEALHLDPNDSLLHVDMGNLKAKEGDLEGAIAHCQEALRLRPRWPEMAAHLKALLKSRREPAPTR